MSRSGSAEPIMSPVQVIPMEESLPEEKPGTRRYGANLGDNEGEKQISADRN